MALDSKEPQLRLQREKRHDESGARGCCRLRGFSAVWKSYMTFILIKWDKCAV